MLGVASLVIYQNAMVPIITPLVFLSMGHSTFSAQMMDQDKNDGLKGLEFTKNQMAAIPISLSAYGFVNTLQ